MFKKLLLTISLLFLAVPAFSENQFIVKQPIVSNDTMFVPVRLETVDDSLIAFEFVCSYPQELTLLDVDWAQSIAENWPIHDMGTNPQFAEHSVAIVYAFWANGINEANYIDGGVYTAFTLVFKINSNIESPVFEYTSLEGCPAGTRHMPVYIYKEAPGLGLRTEPVNVVMEAPTDVNDPGTTLPTRYNLYSNYPNPFNPSTVIKFDLPIRAYVDLQIINVLGQVVETPYTGELSAGTHEVVWNASRFSSGIYFYKLTVNNYTATRKMVLVK